MKPFDSYFGGKAGAGTYQTIINQLPPHKLYIEPFVGGGAIFRHKRPAVRSLIGDRDPAVAQKWIAAGVPEVDSVLRIWDSDKPLGPQFYPDSARTMLAMFDMVLDSPDTLIYLDPPYVLSTRKSGSRYNFEMDDVDHVQLLGIVKGYQDAMIAISGYPSALYEEHLADWRRIEFKSQTRSGASATEYLWMNYPEPTELHDYKYLGANYRERENIAKMTRNMRRKIENLSPLLQRKVLTELLDQVSPNQAVVDQIQAGQEVNDALEYGRAMAHYLDS